MQEARSSAAMVERPSKAAVFERLQREEPVNAAVHLVGFALGLAGTVFLIKVALQRGGPWQWLGCGLYVATLLSTYAASSLSHWIREPRRRQQMRVADQASIFLFIAGSYTPVALTWLRGGAWWILSGFIWTAASAGFLSKSVFRHRTEFGSVSTVLHVTLGWAPVLAARPLMAAAPGALLLWFLAGGVCYTIGVIFFTLDERVPYFHAVWHIWVILGSACQYLGILFYCAATPARSFHGSALAEEAIALLRAAGAV